MYQLIQLSDLESDLINPHDASRNINAVVVSDSAAWGLTSVGIAGCGQSRAMLTYIRRRWRGTLI
jgi:hypothetical protein